MYCFASPGPGHHEPRRDQLYNSKSSHQWQWSFIFSLLQLLTVGTHVCLRLHTILDPSSCKTFAVVSNHLPCVKGITILHAIHGRINILFFCDYLFLVLMLMGISQFVHCQRPCNVQIFRLSNDSAWSRCFSTLRTSEVSRTLVMAQILPIINPSTSVGGTSAHWRSSWDSKPCWPCRHSFTLTILLHVPL